LIFLKDIRQKQYKVLANKPYGSILIEIMISILLLGIIVIGSFYSYSFVHHRILAQREQRNALGVLQGWMEDTTSYIQNNVDPNTLINQETLSNFEDVLRHQFIMEVPSIFARDITVVPNINLISDLNDNKMIQIYLQATLDGLPISLYSEVYARKIEQK